MLSQLQQKAVWEGWLSAETRANYFADLSWRYQRKQSLIVWGTLIFSSGAFATIISDWLPPHFRWIRPTTALLAAALSFWSLIAKNERRSIDCSELHFKLNLLAAEYERLWNDMYADSAPATLQTLQGKSAEISRTANNFPNRKRLMLKWERHVILHHQTA